MIGERDTTSMFMMMMMITIYGNHIMCNTLNRRCVGCVERGSVNGQAEKKERNMNDATRDFLILRIRIGVVRIQRLSFTSTINGELAGESLGEHCKSVTRSHFQLVVFQDFYPCRRLYLLPLVQITGILAQQRPSSCQLGS